MPTLPLAIEINAANQMRVCVLWGEESTPLNLGKMISNLVLSWNVLRQKYLAFLIQPWEQFIVSKQNSSVCWRLALGEFFSQFPTIHQADSTASTASYWLLGFIFSYSPQARTAKLQVSRHFSTRCGLETWIVHFCARYPI